MNNNIVVREALDNEHKALGELMARVYANLEGFPKPEAQPGYYEMLRNVGCFTEKPGVKLLVALRGEKLLGGLVHFADLAHYGAAGKVTSEKNASGFRLLAVDPAARGLGLGRLLMEKSIELAREAGHGQVIIHTTESMPVAWAMYAKRGFQRSEDLDIVQNNYQVYGFRLAL